MTDPYIIIILEIELQILSDILNTIISIHKFLSDLPSMGSYRITHHYAFPTFFELILYVFLYAREITHTYYTI
jgi:hypothetical protein